MGYTVIPSEQTPKVDDVPNGDVLTYIEEHKEKLIGFLNYSSTRIDAVGLAANQLDLDGTRLNLRSFALRDMKTNDWNLIINPLITEYIGIKETKHEGCLTCKGSTDLVVIAQRHRGVLVTYWDIDGIKYTDELHKGFEGQIWQHEVNHLNGVVEVVESGIFIEEPKPISAGRNENCPCGSGKKYKKCCLLLI